MNEYLNSSQKAFLLFASVIGYSVMLLPKEAADYGGTGGWVGIVIASMMMMILIYATTAMGYAYPNKSLYEYSQELVGKTIGKLLTFIYVINFIGILAIKSRSTCNLVQLTMLNTTPTWATCALFMLVVYLVVMKGIKVIARVCQIYGILIIIVAIVIQLAVLTQGRLLYLQPFVIFEDFPVYFKGSFKMLSAFLGIEVLVVLSFQKDHSKKDRKYLLWMMGFIGMFYILIVESCIAVAGSDGISVYKYALYAITRMVEIEKLQIIRRLDGIFLVSWLLSIFCSLSVLAYGAVYLLDKCFKHISYNKLAFAVVATSFITCQFPKNIEQTDKILEYIYVVNIRVILVIPILLFLIMKVKNYVGKNK